MSERAPIPDQFIRRTAVLEHPVTPAKPPILDAPLKAPILSSVPFERERLRNVNIVRAETAAHEWQHWYVAKALNVKGSVSLRQEGHSLARATFDGLLELTKFQVIAAAGSCPTPFGRASGDGMDRYQNAVIAQYYGGQPIYSAISQADMIISKVPVEVRRKISHIMAVLPDEFSDGLLNQVMDRAYYEYRLEQGELKDQSFARIFSQKEEPVRELPREQTIIEDLGKGQYRMIYIINGKKDQEFSYCTKCQGLNGRHAKSCSRNKNESKEQESKRTIKEFNHDLSGINIPEEPPQMMDTIFVRHEEQPQSEEASTFPAGGRIYTNADKN